MSNFIDVKTLVGIVPLTHQVFFTMLNCVQQARKRLDKEDWE